MLHILWGFILLIIALVIAFFIGVIPALIFRLLHLRKIADGIIFFHAAILSNIVLFLCGVKVVVSGDVKELRRRNRKGEGFCFVSNHTSLLDIPIMMGKLRIKSGYVTKRELAFVPILNLFIALVHSVYINRKSLKSSVRAVRKATKNIQNGFSMVIFPEGTRSKTGAIAPFKHGSFRMATESGAYVVPLTIKGLRCALEDRRHAFQKTVCYFNVGHPVKPPKPEEREAVSLMIKEVENGIRSTYERLGSEE